MEVTMQLVAELIRESIQSPLSAPDGPRDAAFAMPQIGCCSGLHPFFDRAQGGGKTRIDPAKWLEAEFCTGYTPDEICVISWALAMPEAARATMRECSSQPALEWIAARELAAGVNQRIARDLIAMFERRSIHAVAPLAKAQTQRRCVGQYGAGLPWSEPVAAVAAGIGAMRPNRGIITPLGSSVALGSVIAAVRLGTEAGRASLAGLCKNGGGCTACQARCPIGAIGPTGFDQALCLKYKSQFVLPYLKQKYDYDGRAVCDLCTTGVPCEFFPEEL